MEESLSVVLPLANLKRYPWCRASSGDSNKSRTMRPHLNCYTKLNRPIRVARRSQVQCPCSSSIRSLISSYSTANRDLGHNHTGTPSPCAHFTGTVVLHSRLLLFLSNLLTLLLVRKDLFLVLLETDEVEVQIFNSIFFEKVLTNQARQVNACLRQSAILVQR